MAWLISIPLFEKSLFLQPYSSFLHVLARKVYSYWQESKGFTFSVSRKRVRLHLLIAEMPNSGRPGGGKLQISIEVEMAELPQWNN
jgi:hypothetical protein